MSFWRRAINAHQRDPDARMRRVAATGKTAKRARRLMRPPHLLTFRLGRADSPACSQCGADETLEHLLCSCPALDQHRNTMVAQLRRMGLPSAASTDLLHPARNPSQVFKVVLGYLADTMLADRLFSYFSSIFLRRRVGPGRRALRTAPAPHRPVSPPRTRRKMPYHVEGEELSPREFEDDPRWSRAIRARNKIYPALKQAPASDTSALSGSLAGPGQPKLKKHPPLPRLPATDFKIVFRPHGGLDLRPINGGALLLILCAGAEIDYNQARSQDKLRINPHNSLTVSTPSEPRMKRYVQLQGLQLNDQQYPMKACVAAPDHAIKGILYNAVYNQSQEEIFEDLVALNPSRTFTIADARQLGRTKSIVVTFINTTEALQGPLRPLRQLKQQHCQIHHPDNTTSESTPCVSTREFQKLKKSPPIPFKVQKPFENKLPTRPPSKSFGVVPATPRAKRPEHRQTGELASATFFARERKRGAQSTVSSPKPRNVQTKTAITGPFKARSLPGNVAASGAAPDTSRGSWILIPLTLARHITHTQSSCQKEI
ncbi:hypothetical protein HPB49_006993 [Dermacentor silvarum]|uniref:Uncharacterized protein n=1 Tax=Dermacentor silvarum TaxID=543639 RepID=A0ACB8C818_DERSI|nr:hypothetical protein HPB49_006993 [Dermacentor silvarum]